MPRGKKSLLIEEIRRLLRSDDRYTDLGAQLRVYRRGRDGFAEKAELLPRVYGGRYDRLNGCYVPVLPDERPLEIVEVSCHPGQLSLLTFDEPRVARVLALGAPGGGKTFAAIRRALLNALDRPNSIGGLVAPTNDRRQILWRDFLELVEPLGWIESVSATKKEIILVNQVVVQVLAAKKPSTQHGSPLQGRSWDWCVADESQNIDNDAQTEIDTRGRRAGTKYVVFETATNAQVPAFRVRLEQYKTSPIHRVVRYAGNENPFVELDHWERLKGLMSDREYREKILAEDVPPEMLVYPRFQFAKNVKQIPPGAVDITARVTQEKYGRSARYVVAQDFGVLVTTSIFLKCYARDTREDIASRSMYGTGVIDRVWYAVDEITSYGESSDLHARKLTQRYQNDDFIVIADPHINTKDADKSDYNMFRREGIDIHPALTGGKIPKKHRISMVNTLLEDANGISRLFIACDRNNQPTCNKLVQSFLSLQYNAAGEAEADKKDYRDMTHWTCALGYGVFPWERVRGSQSIVSVRPEPRGPRN